MSASDICHSSRPSHDKNAREAASLAVDSIAFVAHEGPHFSALIGSFCVRACYVNFYQRVMQWFRHSHFCGVTVTAISGVGTSVFMAYFYLRYQREHPSTTFVLIFFDEESLVQRAMVSRNGESTELATANIADVEMQFSDDPDAIFLLDGPPTHRFVTHHRRIACVAESHTFDLKLNTKPSSLATKLFSSEFGFKKHTGASWFIPQCNAFQSIDAFYLINACVRQYNEEGMTDPIKIENDRASGIWGRRIDAVVFHVMGTDNDHVDGKELYELLTQLEYMCVQVPRLALVYVVPAVQADDFTWQVVKGGFRLNDHLPLTAVDGISVESSEVLKAAHVDTVGDLRRPSTGETLSPEQLRIYQEAQVLLHEHENNAVVPGSDANKQLQAIPQFVWGL